MLTDACSVEEQPFTRIEIGEGSNGGFDATFPPGCSSGGASFIISVGTGQQGADW
jgi:hypothetical protein